jgi:tRNA (cmo5U34)-methyltransferase
MVHDFEFDRNVARGFDDMVRRSVPFYEELQRMTVELAGRFARAETAIVDIGCSTGHTLARLSASIHEPSVRLVGIDNAEAMLERARMNLAEAGSLARCQLELADINDGLRVGPASVVILNWTLQFVRPLHRDTVIQSINEQLVPGGCLIVMEKVLSDDPAINRLYIDLYYDFKKRQGYSELEIAEKRESLENVLVPYRVEENLTLLRRNGFAVADPFFRWYNWAAFLAVKPQAS